MNDFTFNFISPVTGKHLNLQHQTYVTPDGDESYPIIDTIPILVRDVDDHLEMIHNLQESNRRSWYIDDQVTAYGKGAYRHHIKRRKKVIQARLSNIIKAYDHNDVIRMIDLGCGDGASSRWLLECAPKTGYILFTDYNFDRINRARQLLTDPNGPFCSFVLSDITRPVLPPESCDLVFSNHVIEHVPDDFAVFKTAASILKNGGYFVLGCPNEGVFFWMLAYALNPNSIRNSDHVHFYNAETLKDTGERAGLRCKEIIHIGYGIPDWRLDAMVRQFRFFDDLFHVVGSRLFKSQASSLYLIFQKL
ncbi:class I SAM-dependent methyltransferase [candidate division KSB1 bacterium]|nr:class I SAM-dependent methyltransferase [candidate division KSB1 bacterium]